jgi:Mg2+/Co2+ transporter CorB
MAPLLPIGLSIGLVAVLVLLSAFFSSSEIAIFTLSDELLAGRETDTDPRWGVLRGLRDDPHRLLVTILVGNNVVNVAIASITTVVMIEFLPAGSAVTVATVVTSFVVLVFGEIVPKSYGLGHAEEWALRVARPVAIVGKVLYPLVLVFDVITRRMNAAIGGETDIEKPYLDD